MKKATTVAVGVVVIAAAIGAYAYFSRGPGLYAQCHEAISSTLVAPATAKFTDAKILSEDEAQKYFSTAIDTLFAQKNQLAGQQKQLGVLEKADDSNTRVKAMTLAAQSRALAEKIEGQINNLNAARGAFAQTPFKAIFTAVDSQNRAGALVRSDGVCFIGSGKTAVASLEQR